MRKRFLSTIVITFALAVIMMPGPSLAVPGATAYGEASIGYNSLTFSRTDLNWFDMTIPTAPIDTRGSSSGVSVTMGGVTDPYHNDFIDGAPWGNTIITPIDGAHIFSTPANTVAGSAFTNVTNALQPALFASANVALTNNIFPVPPSPPPTQLPVGGIGSVDLAQALFGGLFTVPTDGVLTITASYSLLQQLNLVVPGINNFANSYVDAGLALYDFNGFDPLTQQSPLLASDIRSLSNALTVPGSFTFTDSSSTNPFGLLTLTYNLIALDPLGAPIVYDFEASVTAKSAAQTPEPMTLILLGSGLAGLAIFRKRLS